MDYVSLPELKRHVGVSDTQDDALFDAARTAASRRVDSICGRDFGSVTETRTYWPAGLWYCTIDDLATVTALVVATDGGNDGTYETTWTITTDFILEPANQRSNGIGGWPYTAIRAVGTRNFPTGYSVRNPVSVTGTFGWLAVPAAVTFATKLLAAQLFESKNAPFGVAGFDGFGAVRTREDATARNLLAPYVRPVLVG